MFDTLSENLGSIFDRLRGRGALSEKDVDVALGEIRTALLEADVALPVARAFLDNVRPAAIGAQVLKSVTPGQQMVKIVNDGLIEMLGAAEPLSFDAVPPVVMMMVGLQGSGKHHLARKVSQIHYRSRKTQSPHGLAGHTTPSRDGTIESSGSTN